MSKFVNYSKRDFMLPPGCKDLIDVLQPRGVPRPIKSIATAFELPSVTRGCSTIGPLSKVPRYVAKVVSSRSELFTLMISTIDKRFSMVLYRTESEGVGALVMVSSDAERERALREFFQRQDIELLQDHLQLTEDGPVRSLTCLLPPGPTQASLFATELLRSVYNFTDDSKLRFQHYDLG